MTDPPTPTTVALAAVRTAVRERCKSKDDQIERLRQQLLQKSQIITKLEQTVAQHLQTIEQLQSSNINLSAEAHENNQKFDSILAIIKPSSSTPSSSTPSSSTPSSSTPSSSTPSPSTQTPAHNSSEGGGKSSSSSSNNNNNNNNNNNDDDDDDDDDVHFSNDIGMGEETEMSEEEDVLRQKEKVSQGGSSPCTICTTDNPFVSYFKKDSISEKIYPLSSRVVVTSDGNIYNATITALLPDGDYSVHYDGTVLHQRYSIQHSQITGLLPTNFSYKGSNKVKQVHLPNLEKGHHSADEAINKTVSQIIINPDSDTVATVLKKGVIVAVTGPPENPVLTAFDYSTGEQSTIGGSTDSNTFINDFPACCQTSSSSDTSFFVIDGGPSIIDNNNVRINQINKLCKYNAEMFRTLGLGKSKDVLVFTLSGWLHEIMTPREYTFIGSMAGSVNELFTSGSTRIELDNDVSIFIEVFDINSSLTKSVIKLAKKCLDKEWVTASMYKTLYGNDRRYTVAIQQRGRGRLTNNSKSRGGDDWILLSGMIAAVPSHPGQMIRIIGDTPEECEDESFIIIEFIGKNVDAKKNYDGTTPLFLNIIGSISRLHGNLFAKYLLYTDTANKHAMKLYNKLGFTKLLLERGSNLVIDNIIDAYGYSSEHGSFYMFRGWIPTENHSLVNMRRSYDRGDDRGDDGDDDSDRGDYNDEGGDNDSDDKKDDGDDDSDRGDYNDEGGDNDSDDKKEGGGKDAFDEHSASSLTSSSNSPASSTPSNLYTSPSTTTAKNVHGSCPTAPTKHPNSNEGRLSTRRNRQSNKTMHGRSSMPTASSNLPPSNADTKAKAAKKKRGRAVADEDSDDGSPAKKSKSTNSTSSKSKHNSSASSSTPKVAHYPKKRSNKKRPANLSDRAWKNQLQRERRQIQKESKKNAPDSTERKFEKKKRINKTFEQRVEDLVAYKEEHGHTNVKLKDNKSLYDFCYNIRHTRNNPGKSATLINEERIASLDALGFDWGHTVEKSFAQRVEDLVAFKEKHGHINVKQKEDKSLYSFCDHIRYARRNPEKSKTLIDDERIASLDALGFDWSVTERAAKKPFEQRLEELRQYKEKHGHVNVKKSEDKSLYDFCNNMGQARNNPEKSSVASIDKRLASLDALGFNEVGQTKRGGRKNSAAPKMSCTVGDVVGGFEGLQKQILNSEHQNKYSKEFGELNIDEFAASISSASGNLKTKTADNQTLDQMREGGCSSEQSFVDDSSKGKTAEV